MKIKSDIYKWNSTVLLFRSCLRKVVLVKSIETTRQIYVDSRLLTLYVLFCQQPIPLEYYYI